MIYPLRPKNAIEPKFIGGIVPDHWLIQAKFDGKNMLHDTATGKWWNRHKEERPIDMEIKPSDGHNYLLNGEYMTGTMKDDTGQNFAGFILFDVLSMDGSLLIGSSILERYHLMRSMCAWGIHNEYLYAHPRNPALFLVRNLDIPLREVMDRMNTLPEDGKQHYIEGYVFKNPHQRMVLPSGEYANSAGLLKSRIPTKNYQF